MTRVFLSVSSFDVQRHMLLVHLGVTLFLASLYIKRDPKVHPKMASIPEIESRDFFATRINDAVR